MGKAVAVQDALRPVLVVISFVHGPCLPNGTVCSFLYRTRLPSNGSLASNWLRLHRWRLPRKRVHNHLRLRLHYAWLPRREPCQRSCNQDGYWSPATTDGPEFQPRCVPGLPAQVELAAHGGTSSTVVLKWMEPKNSPDARLGRQWTIFGSRVNSAYHHGHSHRLVDQMETRTEEVGCISQEGDEAQLCSFTYSSLQASTLYSFAVKGSNLAGEGLTSEHVEASTADDSGEL